MKIENIYDKQLQAIEEAEMKVLIAKRRLFEAEFELDKTLALVEAELTLKEEKQRLNELTGKAVLNACVQNDKTKRNKLLKKGFTFGVQEEQGIESFSSGRNNGSTEKDIIESTYLENFEKKVLSDTDLEIRLSYFLCGYDVQKSLRQEASKNNISKDMLHSFYDKYTDDIAGSVSTQDETNKRKYIKGIFSALASKNDKLP